MFATTLRIVVLGIAIGAGAGFVFYALCSNSGHARNIADEKNDEASKNVSGNQEERIRALLKEMADTAKEELGSRMREFEAGRGTTEFLCDASIRLLNAERELSDKGVDRLAALESHLQRMKKVEELNKKWRDQGRTPNKDFALSKYYRLQAKLWLARAKAGIRQFVTWPQCEGCVEHTLLRCPGRGSAGVSGRNRRGYSRVGVSFWLGGWEEAVSTPILRPPACCGHF
jgi:hypothetical protein